MPPVIDSRSPDGRISLDGVDTLMLGANDYLGLSTHPAVLTAAAEAMRRYGTGAAIYPALCMTALHTQLQERLASFLGVEAALLFSSGGAANAAVLATLAGEGDLIVSDQRNHASIIDGARASRAAVTTYATCDAEDLARALFEHAAVLRKLVITDGVFSMEGRLAPLEAIVDQCGRHKALLVVDDAHATGVLGPQARGSLTACGIANAGAAIVLTGSLSKALGGAGGGFAAGPIALIDELSARGRSYIFTQGMTTAAVASTLAAIDVLQSEPGLLELLWNNVALFRQALSDEGVAALPSDSAILSLPVGDEARAEAISLGLRRSGVFAPAMTFPIVARGNARLRTQVSAAHRPSDLRMAAGTIAETLRS
jgi:7-keto-8-aminopelargonate synthetase-like enzyme